MSQAMQEHSSMQTKLFIVQSHKFLCGIKYCDSVSLVVYGRAKPVGSILMNASSYSRRYRQ